MFFVSPGDLTGLTGLDALFPGGTAAQCWSVGLRTFHLSSTDLWNNKFR